MKDPSDPGTRDIKLKSLIGYARVSTTDQDLSLQISALKKEGCHRIFKVSPAGPKVFGLDWIAR